MLGNHKDDFEDYHFKVEKLFKIVTSENVFLLHFFGNYYITQLCVFVCMCVYVSLVMLRLRNETEWYNSLLHSLIKKLHENVL